MKKLMFALGTAAALVGMADIESTNTVGYNTKACEKGKWNIIGVQFEGCDGTMDINKLVSGLKGSDYDEDGVFVQTAPQIQVPNANGTYDLYYYLNDGWYIDEDGNECQKAGWCDSDGMIAGDNGLSSVIGVLTSGVSMWVKDVSNSGTVVQAGQVPTEDSVEVSAPQAFALRANAFPVAFNLNDDSKVTFSGIAGASYDENGAFTQTAPQIQIPNARGTYDLYYYLSDGWYIDQNGDEAQKAGWCDSDGMIAGDNGLASVIGDVAAGQGFWTKGVGSEFKMTFKK